MRQDGEEKALEKEDEMKGMEEEGRRVKARTRVGDRGGMRGRGEGKNGRRE